MSACAQLAEVASAGVAPALRAVDCLAAETTASAFGRLFGSGGGLAPALTILLTLYIALFAFALLTGRSRLGAAALTPRMLTLGLVLTFATSWIAYQQVLWNLASAAPDQIAGLLTGSRGPATQLFADRIDLVFAAIADVAGEQGRESASAAAAAGTGLGSPAGVLWLGALVLLLGTVGVLVTARIVLAVLLAVGPAFIVLALFPGTRGLTAGWLRGVVMTALVPLYVVVGGGIAMELLVPVVANLRGLDGEISGRAAMALFLIAAVHAALMVLTGKAAGTIVSAWSPFGREPRDARSSTGIQTAIGSPVAAPVAAVIPPSRSGVLATPMAALMAGSYVDPASSESPVRRAMIVDAQGRAAAPVLVAPRRARGIGSRFAAVSPRPAGMLR